MGNKRRINKYKRISVDDWYYADQKEKELKRKKTVPLKNKKVKKIILPPRNKKEYTTEYLPSTNEYISGLSAKDRARSKVKIRSFCIKAIKRIGVKSIDGIKLHLHKNKTLFNEHTKLFGTNVVDKYFTRVAMLKKRRETKPEEKDYVYFFVNMEHKVCKIGRSNNPLKRINGVQTGCPYALTIRGFIKGDRKAEAYFHRIFSEYCSNGEWFRIEGRLEAYLDNHFPTPFEESP
jgi:hypothetical protein